MRRSGMLAVATTAGVVFGALSIIVIDMVMLIRGYPHADD